MLMDADAKHDPCDVVLDLNMSLFDTSRVSQYPHEYGCLSVNHNLPHLFHGNLGHIHHFQTRPNIILSWLSIQWLFQEPIHWRYLPYIRPMTPMFQAYFSGNIPTKYRH